MNQAQLRPPKKVYQALWLWCGMPATAYAVFVLWWYPHLGAVQRLYLRSFAKTAAAPKLRELIARKQRPTERTLYCVPVGAYRDAPVIDGMADLRGVHQCTFPLTRPEYLNWLQRYVFHATLWRLLRQPALLCLWIWAPLFLVAWKLDRVRHLKFRSTPRHLRGSQLVTRSEFRQQIKGEASPWFVRYFFPERARLAGIGWRTEDFKEQR